MLNIQPMYDRVLVQKIAKEEKTASGIILTQEAGNSPMGKVIAIGFGRRSACGKELIPLNIKVGDIVMFAPHMSHSAGHDHIIIREDEILGVLNE